MNQSTSERCGCHCVGLEPLARQSSEGWVHLDGHWDAYAATEDRDYRGPVCEPCDGVVGPYTASWYSVARHQFRCAGCLYRDLEGRVGRSVVIGGGA